MSGNVRQFTPRAGRTGATTCPHCGAAVLNMPTRRSGDPMMFDLEPVPGGAWQLDGDMMRRPGAGPRGYTLHARTCPAWQE